MTAPSRTLFDPARHEPLQPQAWNEDRARSTIARIARETEAQFAPHDFWPIHPLDADNGERGPLHPLYFGACGVIWALHYLEAIGAVRLTRSYAPFVDALLPANRAWLTGFGSSDFASYPMGDTGIELLGQWLDPAAPRLDRLDALIAANIDNPTRELMWGSPGTLLAALFLHERTAQPRWAEAFRRTAHKLWSQLEWSPDYGCHYWTQDMYGQRSSYIDAVHGFVATALPLIRGRHLLDGDDWRRWEQCIVNTVTRTATRQGALANWAGWLYPDIGTRPMLVQYCHGAPGFVVCLAHLPGTALDELLAAAGETTWSAGPLTKGANLCHGTAGNAYAFLALYERTRDDRWLSRARGFAMHAITQFETDAARYGRLRFSLWTGDLGLAIFLWDCIRERAAFPTLDVLFAP